jgi:hypothetical protein
MVNSLRAAHRGFVAAATRDGSCSMLCGVREPVFHELCHVLVR